MISRAGRTSRYRQPDRNRRMREICEAIMRPILNLRRALRVLGITNVLFAGCRRLAQFCFMGSLGTVVVDAASLSPPPALIDAEHKVVAQNACAWPMLVTLRDGTIVAIIHNQPSHGQQEGQIEAWATKDGLNWQRRGFPAPNDPGTVRMNVAVGLAGNGDLLVICSGWSDIKPPDREKRPVFRESTLEAWVCRSSDGGFTWTQQKRFVPPALSGWADFIPFGPILAGEDGALHTSCYSGELASEKTSVKLKQYEAFHFRSDDDGKTWKPTSVIAPKHTEVALFHAGGKRWQ